MIKNIHDLFKIFKSYLFFLYQLEAEKYRIDSTKSNIQLSKLTSSYVGELEDDDDDDEEINAIAAKIMEKVNK